MVELRVGVTGLECPVGSHEIRELKLEDRGIGEQSGLNPSGLNSYHSFPRLVVLLRLKNPVYPIIYPYLGVEEWGSCLFKGISAKRNEKKTLSGICIPFSTTITAYVYGGVQQV